MLGGAAVDRQRCGDPTEEQVQVMLDGQTDAAVELDAVLQKLGSVAPDVVLGGADDLGPVRSVVLDRLRRISDDGVTGFEPKLQVSEAMLDLLVGGQRPT